MQDRLRQKDLTDSKTERLTDSKTERQKDFMRDRLMENNKYLLRNVFCLKPVFTLLKATFKNQNNSELENILNR